MGQNGKYVHKLVDSPAEVNITNVYTTTGRKDITVPSGNALDGICGRISCIRMYGNAHTGAAKDMTIIVTYDQAGTKVWLDEVSAPVTHGPFAGGQWSVTLSIEHLGKITPSDCPEGTISVFAHVDAGTATWNDVHFLWEE